MNDGAISHCAICFNEGHDLESRQRELERIRDLLRCTNQ